MKKTLIFFIFHYIQDLGERIHTVPCWNPLCETGEWRSKTVKHWTLFPQNFCCCSLSYESKPRVRRGELDDSFKIFWLFHWPLQNVSVLMEPRPGTTQGKEVKVWKCSRKRQNRSSVTDELEINCVCPPIKSSVKLREPELNWSWSVSSGNPGQINFSERIKGQVCVLFHCWKSLFHIAFEFQRLSFTERFVLL